MNLKRPSPYPYRRINHHKHFKISENLECILHVFSFRGRDNIRYIVNVEQYDYELYCSKFYRQSDKIRDDKYSILTKKGDGFRIFATLIQIQLDILHDNQYASFLIKGSECEGESVENTKRFRVYRQIMINYSNGTSRFDIRNSAKYSCLLMLNKDNIVPDLPLKIEKMLKDGYGLS